MSPLRPYNPLAQRYANNDSELDAKVKVKFDVMSRKEWLAYLEECKANKLEADKARAKEEERHIKGKNAEKEERRLKRKVHQG
ncbi:hypothetical protein B0H10DRAFT_2223158 [Mycena sp. CBHHK59/15]|nr:hypothetical protein B0H10DRAFT_2223158 [Mycena sp. CBHHK59/15]